MSTPTSLRHNMVGEEPGGSSSEYPRHLRGTVFNSVCVEFHYHHPPGRLFRRPRLSAYSGLSVHCSPGGLFCGLYRIDFTIDHE